MREWPRVCKMRVAHDPCNISDIACTQMSFSLKCTSTGTKGQRQSPSDESIAPDELQCRNLRVALCFS
ncbi:hypothetical protein EUGRSUZ_G00710 [Eucalyptus grandis]|uniref:Uncharacterized protein n=2 Tax=Eucalyptus grandis TaxID=71139 RepID=A0ACC3K0D4_EUCGR|nr:hypothetical protein EUGRSUZ_G00710 [Eucalyptus grandis]